MYPTLIYFLRECSCANLIILPLYDANCRLWGHFSFSAGMSYCFHVLCTFSSLSDTCAISDSCGYYSGSGLVSGLAALVGDVISAL